jgi:hypothetical protein
VNRGASGLRLTVASRLPGSSGDAPILVTQIPPAGGLGDHLSKIDQANQKLASLI